MKKFLVLILILSIAAFVFGDGKGTTAGTLITNTATVGAANMATTESNAVGTNVIMIDGGIWTSTQADQGGAAGGTYTYITTFTNEGNTNQWFAFTAVATNTNGSTGGGVDSWTTSFSNQAIAGATVTRCTLAPDDAASIDFKCTVSGSAANGSYVGYILLAEPRSNSSFTAYIGDNGTNYGGTISEDAEYTTGEIVCNGTAGRIWTVTIAGPLLAIDKSIEAVDTLTSGAIGAGAYPGATITYKIAVTNTGTGGATGVYVRDSIPANTTYEAGTLQIKVGSAYTNMVYGNAANATPTDADGGDAGACDGSIVEFTPNGTAASIAGGGEDGTIDATGAGDDVAVCWFRVVID